MWLKYLCFYGFFLSALAIEVSAADRASVEPYAVGHQRKELETWKTNLKYELTPTFTSLIQGHEEEIPEGTLLYHGTLHALPQGMPDMPVNFFSFDSNQAMAHPLNRFDEQQPPSSPPRVYTYRVKKAIPHILPIHEKFAFKAIFEALRIDEHYHPDNKAIGKNNQFIALILKKEREAGRLSLNGFSHRHDQNELELDDPKQYLELVEVREFKNLSIQENPWDSPVENPSQNLPCLQAPGYTRNPVYQQNYALAGLSYQQAASAQRRFAEHERRYKNWCKSLKNYVDQERVFFVRAEVNGVMKNFYDYTPEQFRHSWLSLNE